MGVARAAVNEGTEHAEGDRGLRLMLWAAALAGSAAALVLALRLLPSPVDRWPIPDLQVYREAVGLLLDGGDPYSGQFGLAQLPYTYPPFSLLLFLPLAVAAPNLWAIAVANTVLLAVVVWAVLRSYPQAGRRTVLGITAQQAVVGALILIGAQVLQPIRSNIHFGQVNVMLMAVVVTDMLVVKTRWRGILTGVAAMVKLTPLVFVILPLWARERRVVWHLLAAIAACVVLAAVVMPRSTVWFFTHGMLAQDRPGATYPGVTFNQSLRGLSLRVFNPGVVEALHTTATTAAELCWLASVALALVLLYFALRGLDPVADRALGLGYIATAGLLVSPISWTHHWVWVVPLAVAAVSSARRFPLVIPPVALMAAVMVGDPWFNSHWFAAGSLAPAAAVIVLNLYVLAGLLVLVAGAWYGRRRRGDVD